MGRKSKKILQFIFECGKWGLVVYLLLPLTRAMSEEINFSRVAFGILLFILFSGKLFYDTLFQRQRQHQPSSTAGDLLFMLAMVFVLSLVIGLVVLSIGMLVFSLLKDASAQ